MTGLLGIRNLIDDKIERNPRFFWPRMAFTVAALAAAVVGAGFVRLNALRLESIAPFFEPGDFAFGMVLTVGVLALTLQPGRPTTRDRVRQDVQNSVHAVTFKNKPN